MYGVEAERVNIITVVCAYTLAIVRIPTANFLILGSGEEEVSILVVLDVSQRALMPD